MTWPFGIIRPGNAAVIVCDYPWAFKSYSGDVVPQRAKVQHYPTMPIKDGKALPVARLGGTDCALFMWSTSSHTRICFDLATSWGFEFKGKAFCWAKLNRKENEYPDDLPTGHDKRWFMGQGYGTRRNTEDCWLFVRGNPKRVSAGVRELIVAPLREHSRKPDEALERIERLYKGPYVELFARSSRHGWSSWGNETGKFT